MNIRDLFGKLMDLADKADNFKNQYATQDMEPKPPKKRRSLKWLLLLPLIIGAVSVILSCQYTVEES